MSGSYFDQIRENVAMDIKELLYEVIIPQFEKENNTEHILRIAGEDLDKVNALMINQRTRNELLLYIARENKIPTQSQFEIIKTVVGEAVKQGKKKLLKIAKGFYQNLKYKIDIDIVGEAMDVGVRATNKWMALQAVSADPTMLSDPIKRKFFSSWLEDGGLHMVDFEAETTIPSIETLPQRVGGGISRPVVPPTPTVGAREATI